MIDWESKEHKENKRLITADFLLKPEDLKSLWESASKKILLDGKKYNIVEPTHWPLFIGQPKTFRVTLKEC